MDAGWARARFHESRVARLATADAGGRPHLVPIVFAVIGESIVTAIDGKPKTDPRPGARLRRLDNVRANPSVSLLVDAFSDDWARLWWARADGAATIVDAADPAGAAAIAALAERYPQYREATPPGPVIVIDVRAWSGWAATDLRADGDPDVDPG